MAAIKHWQVISDLVNEHGVRVMAEIGVWKSHFIRGIFHRCECVEQYWAVDQWEVVGPEFGRLQKRSAQDWDDLYKYCCSLMIHYPALRVLRMKSIVAAPIFPDGYFDLIYIDADHRYEAVKDDIVFWLPKVKEGGIVAGHDYGSARRTHRGVTVAVNEVLGVEDLVLGEDSVWYKKVVKT